MHGALLDIFGFSTILFHIVGKVLAFSLHFSPFSFLLCGFSIFRKEINIHIINKIISEF